MKNYLVSHTGKKIERLNISQIQTQKYQQAQRDTYTNTHKHTTKKKESIRKISHMTKDLKITRTFTHTLANTYTHIRNK